MELLFLVKSKFHLIEDPNPNIILTFENSFNNNLQNIADLIEKKQEIYNEENKRIFTIKRTVSINQQL